MIIVDPVTLGDVTCSRASPKWVYDRTGTLVQVPADTLAVTYDPSDLSKAPYASIEAAATNLLLYSEDFSKAAWSKDAGVTATVNSRAAPDGSVAWDIVDASTTGYGILQVRTIPNDGTRYTLLLRVLKDADESRFPEFLIRMTGGTTVSEAYLSINTKTGAPSIRFTTGGETSAVTDCGAYWLVKLTVANNATGNTAITFGIRPAMLTVQGGPAVVSITGSITAWGAMLAAGDYVGSHIPTTDAPVTRAADVIAPGAGLVYSNVPITEAPYNAGTTYAKNALVYDPVSNNVFQSVADGNVGKALTDQTAWTPRGATNRWAMLDQYNNTQTTNADEILMVVSPQAISQGLYLGNLYADEVRVSVVDKVEGLVYSETKSLIESNSGSSFYNWFFKRIKRRDYFLTLKLPVYANALVTISLRKIGGVAKCGMCAIGPTDDFGPTLMGLSTEGKDYSSTTFNFDGTSSTVIRPYAKRMTCDVMVDNDQIDYLQARLFEIRQKPIVWVGGPYGSTAVYGRYESFKNVIQYATRSLMNLTIGGAV